MAVDVETRGELTRGMTVVDRRAWERPTPNAEVVTGVDRTAVHGYMKRVLRRSV
jgi:inosine-uridine nucleoside N-ribohydrolase